MNKNLFRIIFNQRRGQLMAVAETASSQGQGARGEAMSSVRPAMPDGGRANLLGLNFSTLCAFGSVLCAFTTLNARAQVVAYKQAPGTQQPTVLQTSNGVPQINIQTPSAAGVSRNAYSQFDVQANGAILNNSRTNVQTQLGGWVQGNPWLGTGSARVILNEVTSSNPSVLNGYVEVAGQRAEVVIANPSGIAVNGGGFINTSKATLTTGTPIVNGGNVDGYRVQAGSVTVNGQGLDLSTTDYAAILARAVQVNAGIWANELKVVTGANQIDASSLAANTTPVATAIAGTGAVPSFAFDVAQIGGMYAGKIHLIGTEQGLGVRSAGTLSATGGDLVLQNNGWLTNTGTLQASANVQITTQGNITHSGTIYAGNDQALTATGSITNNGVVAAQGNTSITADSLNSSVTGVLAAGVKTDGTLAGSGSLNMATVQALAAHGQNLSAGDLNLSGGSLDLSDSQTSAKNIGVTTAGNLSTSRAAVVASQNLNLSSAQLDNTAGTLTAGQNANLQTAALNNDAGLIQVGGNLTVNTHGQTLANTHAASYTNSNSTLNGKGGIAVQGTTTLITGDLKNDAGYIGSKGALTASTANLSNTQMGQIQGLDNLTLAAGEGSAAGTMDNTGGLIRSAATVNIHAAEVHNNATLGTNQGIEGQDVSLVATQLNNTRGAIRANNNVSINSAGTVDNTSGLMSAGNALTLQDTQAPASRTLVVANAQGSLMASQSLTVLANRLGGDGSLLSNNDLMASLNADFSNSGKLQAGHVLSLSANNIDNAVTGEISAHTTQVNAVNTLNNRGLIDGVETQINANTVNNIGTGRLYGDHLSVAAIALTNDTETVNGLTQAATIAARNRLDLGIRDTLTNREHALIYSVGDMAIGGALDANRQATGFVTTLNNHSATLEAGGDLALSATTLNNIDMHFSTALEVKSTAAVVEYQGSGASARYASGTPGVYTYEDESLHLSTPDGNYEAWTKYEVTRTISETTVKTADPSKILAGGAIRLYGDSLLNDNSQIVAGAALNATVASIRNTQTTGNQVVHDAGTATSYWRIRQKGTDTTGSSSTAYNPADAVTSINVTATRYQQNTAPTGTGTQVAALKTANVDKALGTVNSSQVQAVNLGGLTALPTSSLYKTNPANTASYLVETDPRFTNNKSWLSSDYMTQNLSLDPSVTQKRLGDGFYEQKLIREQVAQLTGRRFLADYTSDEQEYKALMANAITFANQYKLRPGIALSAQQMAQLTSDIVWLVEQSVTLADGSTQKVLVPQLYVKTQAGDLDGSGALLAGKDVNLNLRGDLTNTGTMAGRNVLNLSAENVNNLGGRLTGAHLNVAARQDLNNLGGSLSAINSLNVMAGRDLNVQTTTFHGANAQTSLTGIDRVAGLYVSDANGTLVASAGRDLNLIAGVINNAGTGETQLTAGQNLNFATVNTEQSHNIAWDSHNFRQDSARADVGSTVQAGGSVTLQAGQTFHATAANVQATDALNVNAANIQLQAGQSSSSVDEAHQHTSRGFLSKTTTTTRDTSSSTTAMGSSLGGNTISLQAQNDVGITGSSVVSDEGTSIAAAGNVSIEAATNTLASSSYRQETQSGLMGSGGLGVTVGQRKQSLEQQYVATSAAASTVGSVHGDIRITAGKQYRQVGSDVSAPQGDITIAATTVDIVEARETRQQSTAQKFEQSGMTLGVSNGLVSYLQSPQSQLLAASQTKSSRMKALAVANEVAGVATAAQSAPQMDFTVSFGHSQSESKQTSQSDTARDSTVQAGGSLSIQARGAGQDSHLTIQGSDVSGNTVNLQADGQVNLLAAKNTTTETTASRNSSASVGASMGTSGIGITASAAMGKGNGNGTETRYTNTHVLGADSVRITSGGDTTLKGATVKGKQVDASVGGNLSIESLQDTATYSERNQQVAGSVMVSLTPASPSTGNLNVAKSQIHSDYASVTEQSGIQAGDSGFNVKVGGNTDLIGGAIVSTQTAVDQHKNSFSTGGTLTTRDIQNKASYDANSISVNVGLSSQSGQSASSGTSGIGFGNDKGHAASTTTAGISGIAGDSSKRTGDKEQGIQPIFNRDQVKAEIDAQTAITGEFGKQASSLVGAYAQTKLEEAIKNNDQAGIDAWREGGSARVALHTAVGGLTGGVAGAVGAGTSQAAIAQIGQAIKSTDLPLELKEALVAAAGTAVGVVASGGNVAGGATAFNATVNNYLTHDEDFKRTALRKRKESGTCDTACDRELSALNALDEKRDAEIQGLMDICRASNTSSNCEAVAKHYADTNGYGFASAKFESAGRTGSPFSFNGHLVGKGTEDEHYEVPQIKQADGSYKPDPGGFSFGPFQLSANTGGMAGFLNYLNNKNASDEAKGFYNELTAAGGLEAAQRGDKNFVNKFMELTQRDPQFTEYQFESINQTAIQKVIKNELKVAGVEFDELNRFEKEAIFSIVVQNGGRGADRAIDYVMSTNFAQKQIEYNKSVQDGKTLVSQENNLITQIDQLKDKKISLLESKEGAGEQKLRQIDSKIQSLDQKLMKLDAQVQANASLTQGISEWMKEVGRTAFSDDEQFIRDLYQWRIDKRPSEAASRFIPERNLLLKMLKDSKN